MGTRACYWRSRPTRVAANELLTASYSGFTRTYNRSALRLRDSITYLRGIPLRRRLRTRRRLARRYLRGEGIEIGALHLPLELPAAARVRYVDRLPTAALREHYPELAGEPLVDVEIIDDGEQLATVPDGSQDFVVANHFLEHCEDPIRALTNMLRVLKPRGVLYLAVPDKRNTFDAGRLSTPLEHLVADHEEGPERSRSGHYDEWARFVDGRGGADAEVHARELEAKGYSIHFHVWTHEELLELYEGFRHRLPPHELELATKNVDESVLILRSTREGRLSSAAGGTARG